MNFLKDTFIFLLKSKIVDRFPQDDSGNQRNMDAVFRPETSEWTTANFLCFPTGNDRKVPEKIYKIFIQNTAFRFP